MVRLTPRRSRPHGTGHSPNHAVIALLSALAIVAGGLSGAALLSQGAETDPQSEGQAGPDENPPSPASGGAENRPTDRHARKSGDEVASERLLAVSSDPSRLIRAEGTSCNDDGTVVEVSSDRGETWLEADISEPDVSGVKAIHFGEAGSAQLAYVDAQCEMQFAKSYVYGAAWESVLGADGLWALVRDEGDSEISLSGGRVESPCQAVDISGFGERASLLCENSTATHSEDSGDSWSNPIEVPGAVAVVAESSATFVVRLSTEDCQGVSVQHVEDDSAGEVGACAEGDYEPSRLATASGGGELYVWAGDDVLRSIDGGSTWE